MRFNRIKVWAPGERPGDDPNAFRESSKGKMDLFSTLTFFPLVLQIGLFGMAPGLARAEPEANEQGLNSVEAVALRVPGR
jgi:hypothetical protein